MSGEEVLKKHSGKLLGGGGGALLGAMLMLHNTTKADLQRQIDTVRHEMEIKVAHMEEKDKLIISPLKDDVNKLHKSMEKLSDRIESLTIKLERIK